MSSVSQSTTSTTSNSLDSLTDFGSAQASAYAQALLAGTNVNPAAFKDASFSLLSIIALDKKSEEVETLQAELSRLKVSMTASTTRKSRQRGAGDTVGTSLEHLKERITKDIRALAAMECLWLSDNSFQQPPLLSNPFPSAPDRYASDENLDLYHTYILYTCLHVDYHGPLEGQSLLRKQVQQILSQERSTLVKNVRTAGKDIFFGFPPIVSQAVCMKEYARAREPECLRFLVSPRQVPSVEIRPEDLMPPLKYLDLPPLLFPELDSTRAQEIFRCNFLIQIARCILFRDKAPGRVLALQEGRIESNTVSSNCLARQRNITRTTPGLIATAAILACFVVSGDTVFSEKGAVTGAAYRSRYLKFKLLLEESLGAGEPHTITTFKFWDQQLFAVENGQGEDFEFGSLDERDEDELSKHRRAVMLHTSPASMQASSTGSPTTVHSVSAARPNRTPQSAPTSTSGLPLHPPHTVSISSGQPTLQITPSPSPGVHSEIGERVFTPHLSYMARSSAPIPASQPGSQVFQSLDNEDEGSDTEPDVDVTPVASVAPISRSESPIITLSATPSHCPSANDLVFIEVPATQVMPIDEQQMASGSNDPNLATQPRNSRRDRPSKKGLNSAQPGPGPSTRELVQQSSGPDATAAPPMRSKLRSRANIGKH
ncbi:hypothetical protein AGABI2DRAFT_119995 [Agaricus bisporus var. bisporus H97]|uniref:hypothetical protein n=1 Tax=Agaricus bisporus var. bisporus (strain H97 / ATCC MYA-4626 / FGSC 10389) TaxID=936046 RepID=UPI00029F7A60|nr:hypothetical protein AGABI2DRAFT_119995 [Agaricus bisporus var. bisporus H97]EKV45018.1 hypothetical protein AGABI2DRAFT_119995 [Agaricus bisporus var. bisporus H97]